jgi:hypothetical protein
VRLLCPLTEKKDKILSAHNQIDTGNSLSNIVTFYALILDYVAIAYLYLGINTGEKVMILFVVIILALSQD